MAETYFRKSLKGYDPEQVDAFIISLSDTYDNNLKEKDEKVRAAENESARLRDEIAELRSYIEENASRYEAELAKKQEEYDRLYAEIGEKMVTADKRASEIVKNAEKEAALIIAEAKRSSENDAVSIRAHAEEEANRLIEDTRIRCEDISAKAEEFRMKQDEMNRSIRETEKRFGDALSKLREGFGGNTNDN